MESPKEIILLDLNLEDSEGLDSLKKLHYISDSEVIIVITAVEQKDLGLNLVRHGAQDYLLKQELTLPLLKKSILYAVERKKLENQLKYSALHDPLTGLPNRLLLFNRLQQLCDRIQWQKDLVVALLFIDVNNFKEINDTYGHAAGDEVLIELGKRLQQSVFARDTVARYAGDEFVVLLDGLQMEARLVKVIEKLKIAFRKPVYLKSVGKEMMVSVSIGIAVRSAEHPFENIDQLIQAADFAMYEAKKQSRKKKDPVTVCRFHQEQQKALLYS
ncbi:MAG: diguanylate cyclase [Candidatus Hydrogenedentota bacterium]|nr:MAG: diguanylate cyclase [Candidatus Hydrogenedentota bacterium]